MDRFSIDEILNQGAGLSAQEMEQLANFAGLGYTNLNLVTGEIHLNRNTALLAGYEPGDLPHSRDTKFMLTYEDDIPKLKEAMESLFSGKTDHYQLEYRMRRQDGSLVFVYECAIISQRDKDGAPLRMAGFCQDLSRLKWAEERAREMERENRRLTTQSYQSSLAEQNRMLRAANSAAAMIIGGFHQDYETVLRLALQILGESIQADRAYIWRNRQIDDKMYCFQRAEWARLDDSSPVSEEDMLCYDDFFPDWRQTSPDFFLQTTYRDLNPALKSFPGMEGVKALMITPLFLHGEFWGFLGFDDCTSERCFTQEEAEIMNAGALVIASSVSRNETFSRLNEARAAAMASTKAKGEFLSRMSHEIRTPMNAIIGMTTIAKSASDPERIRYCLDKVDSSSRQLLGLINDILDMSKIDANKLEITNAPFDFEKMIQNVINVVQVKLEEKHQNFHLDFNHVFTRYVLSDELRLSQVLINLLGNAIKFTPDQGTITLHIQEQAKDNGCSCLHIEVIDTGIGIAKDSLSKLFDSFEQADGGITRQYGGTGLGLSISRKIIHLMQGDIWVESTLGVGTKFVFELEIGWGAPLLSCENAASVSSSLQILVVDDSEDVREYFQNILSSFSLSCDVAPNGETAIDMVKQRIKEGKQYDIVFIDWNMPGLNGGETAGEIRELVGNDVINIMISVAEWSDIEKKAKHHGVKHFLSKPVLPSVLYDTIATLASKQMKASHAEAADQVHSWIGKQVLLAEDVEINREILASFLEETGINLTFAVDGEQAVNCFSQSPDTFDLILMDVQMPKMDGLMATRTIRSLSHPRAKTIPIAAMTANAFKEDEQMCLDAGMNVHLAKPFNVDDLYHLLHTYLDP